MTLFSNTTRANLYYDAVYSGTRYMPAPVILLVQQKYSSSRLNTSLTRTGVPDI